MVYPAINPVALSIGPLHVHWYGVLYLVGFLFAWGLGRYRIKVYHLAWTKEQLSDLIFCCAMGVVLGGRLGYMIFYDAHRLFHSPWTVVKLWEGGMSFHGGLLGVMMALAYVTHKYHKPLLAVGDFVAPLVPLGLAAGRLGNFINGELWGRATTMPWAMVFPRADETPRHPSQLYELGLEGLLLFVLIWWYAAKPRPAGCVSGVFLMAYALCRLTAECFRQPDHQLGFIAFHFLTMGQLLSLPMLIGGFLLWQLKKNTPDHPTETPLPRSKNNHLD
jgi:phosphatidylglycerol:prolipoprotein diacylglycerol transferase